MGSTNKTTNYELSQFLGSDKPAWLLDYNGDMLKIDTQMKANADAASAAQSKADTADGKADDLRTDLTTLNNQVNDPTGLAADVATLSGTMNAVTSLIGNGEPTTTDKTLIGAINELDADINGTGGTEEKIGDLTNLTTTAKNNLVGAINEVDSGKQPKVYLYDIGTIDNNQTQTFQLPFNIVVDGVIKYCPIAFTVDSVVHLTTTYITDLYISGNTVSITKSGAGVFEGAYLRILFAEIV